MIEIIDEAEIYKEVLGQLPRIAEDLPAVLLMMTIQATVAATLRQCGEEIVVRIVDADD